jgi:hypothetical protein
MKQSIINLYESAARAGERAKIRNAIASQLGYHLCDKHPQKEYIDRDELLELLDKLEDSK